MMKKPKTKFECLFRAFINVKILTELNSQKEIHSVSQLYKKIDSTLSSVHQRLKLLQKFDLLSMKKEGRCLKINLTEKGKLVATKLHELKLLLISDTPKTIHL